MKRRPCFLPVRHFLASTSRLFRLRLLRSAQRTSLAGIHLQNVMRPLPLALMALGALCFCGAAPAQQQPPPCQPWIGIKSWQVSVHVQGGGTMTDSLGYSASLSESDDVQFAVLIDSSDGVPCSNSWSWTTVQSPKVNMRINATASSPLCTREVSYSAANVDGGGGSIGMDFVKGTYFGTYGFLGEGSWTSDNYSGEGCFQGGEFFYDTVGLSTDPSCTSGYDPSTVPISGGLPASGALSGSSTFTCPSQALTALGGYPLTEDTNMFSWTITWSMTPTPANLNLVVTIPSYSTWRPTGGRTEKEVGVNPTSLSPNVLGVRAQLIDKDSGMPSYLIPDKVTFALASVSHEPGVAMNWPPKATATSDADLTFDCEYNFSPALQIKVDSKDCLSDFTLTGSQIEIDPQTNSNPIAVSLSPHDWGGWGTLNVTATVGGVSYQGSLDTDPGNTDILLPKRQADSFVADGWKSANGGVGLPDNDDSERNPKGSGPAGDGFTLYEEYRGFYMGCSDDGEPQSEGTAGATCQHVDGDPTRQDYFVVDHTGSDRGIKLFASAAGLKVHFRGMKCEEMDGTSVQPDGSSDTFCNPAGDPNLYRTINFNTEQGPHKVPQHGVVMNWGGNGPISHVVTTSDYVCQDGTHSCPALPKHIDHIEMSRGLWTGGSDDSASIVAHELSHSVDVYHHGDIDHVDPEEFWTFDKSTNTTKAVYGAGGVFQVSVPISIYLETSNLSSPDPADFDAPNETLLGLDQALKNKPPKDSAGNAIPGRYVYVGNSICGGAVQTNGQHSGDENSVMRYHVAQAYIPNGFPSYRIWIGPGAEAAGTTLTDHPEGTGVNDPTREIPPDPTPRPRYGDAFTGRGNDLSQISVSDSGTESRLPTQTCP